MVLGRQMSQYVTVLPERDDGSQKCTTGFMEWFMPYNMFMCPIQVSRFISVRLNVINAFTESYPLTFIRLKYKCGDGSKPMNLPCDWGLGVTIH